MAQLANKRRRLGQTRATSFAPLHPQAQDTRASHGKGRPEHDDITAPPLSSSDEDVTDAKHDGEVPKSAKKPIYKRPPKPGADSGINDSPFRGMTSQTRPKATYSRANGVRGGGMGMLQGSKALSSKKDSTTDTNMPRKNFKTPAETKVVKKKAEFRAPAAVEFVPPKASFRVPALVERTPPKAAQFRMPSGSLQDVERLIAASSSQDLETACNESIAGTQPASSQPLDNILSSNTAASFAASLAEADRELSPDTFAACPVCRTPLSEAILDAFQSTLAGLSAKARYHRQAAFCRAHREEDAQRTWIERGYPTIDWTTLSSRLEPYRSTVLDILEDRQVSHFRTQLQAELDARRAAGKHIGRDTLAEEFQRADDGGESVGYYGGRGAQVMMTWLAKSLAEPLRAASETDPLIQACGSMSAFVQRVLLPELATLLVVEDMRDPKARRKKQPASDKEAEEARQRLKDSAELGRLLCLEEDDEIIAEDEDVEARSGSEDSDLSEGEEEEEEEDEE